MGARAWARAPIAGRWTASRARARVERGARARVGAGESISKNQEYMGGLGGDIGARDATVGEIESGFTETCLGHADTDHMNRAPKAMADMIKLAVRQIGDDGYDAKLTFEQQEVFRKQVWDWKIRPGKGNFECLRREFSVKDGDAEALVEKINAKCEAEGWTPAYLGATSGSNVVCELGSDAVKGITTNDFILAAKIDETEDILSMVVKAAPKARNWF